MLSEPAKIIFRRFGGRLLESGLLILAVALGVGAAASGLSLLGNTRIYADKMLSSPQYKEIVVSSRNEAADMEQPVIKKPAGEEAILTSADLDAAELAPAVSHAYIANRTELRLISTKGLERTTRWIQERENQQPQEEGNSQSQEERRGPTRITTEEIEQAKADSSILIAETIEEIPGYSVTPDFFNAWNIQAKYGSLFSESDMANTNSLVILGAKTAEALISDTQPKEKTTPENLVGKKILTRRGYQTVIGILQPVADTYNEAVFQPYQNYSAGNSSIRWRALNTKLRFTVDSAGQLGETASLLQNWFESKYGQNQIVISNPRQEAEQLIDRNTGISLLILFLSCAALFIASVNVSHILMSRAIRMKKHVGILMAVGSTKMGILKLFVLEALTVTLSGTVIGFLFSIPLSKSMQNALDIGNGNILYILLGSIAAWILTLLFSLVPAWQHSKIQPAQAIQAG